MKDIFFAKTSLECVHICVNDENQTPRRGLLKRLSDHLKCHPTFVSQVVAGKAYLNTDQALLFSDFFSLDSDETEQFLDLLHKDRAGTKKGRDYFQKRIDQRVEASLDLKNRLHNTQSLPLANEAQYYNNWFLQALNAVCQCDGQHNVQSIAQKLGMPQPIIEQGLNRLRSLGLVELNNLGYKSTNSLLHIGKDSPNIQAFHSGWRLKVASDLGIGMHAKNLHYSSVVSLSRSSVNVLRETFVKCIEDSRRTVMNSKSEVVCVFLLDFFALS